MKLEWLLLTLLLQKDVIRHREPWRSCKVKVKVALCTPWRHTGTWAYMLHSFRTLALDGEWLVSRPRPSYFRGNRFPVRIDRSLGGPQNRSGPFGEENKHLPLSEREPQFLGSPANNIKIDQD